MKFFVDTADIADIKELADTGLLDGVTTNPSLIAKSGRDILEVTKEICDLVDGPVSAEVVATEADQMLAEGRHLAKIADNIAVKVPLTWDGLKACKVLTGEGNMAHSLANLEHHHFKYRNFRRPGDVHVHFFGTATLSFADKIVVEPGDVDAMVDGMSRLIQNVDERRQMGGRTHQYIQQFDWEESASQLLSICEQCA